MNNKPPNITAIITCMTDSERPYLKEAIDSVINQTIPCSIRVYVELSNQWINDLKLPKNKNIIIRHLPLEPAGIIRNIGVQESNSEWVAFLDGDDVWMPNKIKRQLQAASFQEYDFITTDHYMIDEKGKLIACGLGANNVAMTSTWMAKRELFIRLPFTAKLVGQDAEWWFKSLNNINKKRVSAFLIRYRLREISASSLTPEKKRKMQILKASRNRGTRYLIIVATWLVNKLNPIGLGWLANKLYPKK